MVKKRIIIVFNLMVIFSFIFIYGSAHAEKVYGEGFSCINAYGEDIAYEIALKNAIRRAAEKGGKIKVYAKTLNTMGVTVKSFAEVSLKAIIKNFRVLETRKKDNRVYVKIEADIVKDKNSILKKNLSNRNVIILHKGEGSRKIFDVLYQLLSDAEGLNLYTIQSLKNYLDEKDIKALENGNIPFYSSKFLSLLANSVIFVETFVEETGGNQVYKYFMGNCSIKRFKIDSGVAAPVDQVNKSVKFFGKKLKSSLNGSDNNSFYGKLTNEENCILKFTKKYFKSISRKKRTIKISVKNIAKKNQFNSFVHSIENFPYISPDSVLPAFMGKSGKIEVRFSEKTVYLASMIDNMKNYEVTDYGDNYINLVRKR